MRILIDLEGTPEVIDLQAYPPQATLAGLVDSACGYTLTADDKLYLDHVPVTGETTLGECTILEGSILTRKTPERVQNIAGWNVSVAGGFAVGPVVVVPEHRPLIIGRALRAELVLPTECASWEHCTIELTDDGVQMRVSGSSNGTSYDYVICVVERL